MVTCGSLNAELRKFHIHVNVIVKTTPHSGSPAPYSANGTLLQAAMSCQEGVGMEGRA